MHVFVCTKRHRYSNWEDRYSLFLCSKPRHDQGMGEPEQLYETHYQKLEVNKMDPKVFYETEKSPRFSYTFVPELGRFQDIVLIWPEDKSTPIDLLDKMDEGPYSIFAFEAAKGCVDKYGYFANRIYQSVTCMSLQNLRLNKTKEPHRYYAGPITFNRVRFDEDDYMLLYLLTNRSTNMRTSDSSLMNSMSMKNFVTCKHAETKDTDLDPQCHSAYNIFDFSRICCCFHGNCTTVDREYFENKDLKCPIGEYNATGFLPPIMQYDYDEYGYASRKKFCQVEMLVLTGNNNTELYVKLNGSQHIIMGPANIALDDGEMVCGLQATQCAGDLNTVTYNKDFAMKCYCPEELLCANYPRSVYETWNLFAGRLQDKEHMSWCQRVPFFGNELHPHVCHVFYDVQKKRPVVLVDNYNFFLIGEMYFITDDIPFPSDPKADITLVTFLSGIVTRKVIDDCQTSEDVVYEEEDVNQHRLFYFFTCEAKNCDLYIEDNIDKYTETLKEYEPQCMTIIAEHNFMKRVGDYKEDRAAIIENTVMKNATQTGFCFFQYISEESQHTEDVGYVIRPALPSDIKNHPCPTYNVDPWCRYNEETLSFCCLSFNQKIYSGSKVEEYKWYIFIAIQAQLSPNVVATGEDAINDTVSEPGKCAVHSVNDGLLGVSEDQCGEQRGCYDEFVYVARSLRRVSGCTTDAVTAVIKNGTRPIHGGVICSIKQHVHDHNYPYRDECIVADTGLPYADGLKITWPNETMGDRLQSTKVICCCHEKACDDLTTKLVFYYADFVDGHEDDLKEKMEHLDH
ncbi:unnamed protein product [Bursaphelenchus okinawaensis]|uniref:Uncharacterized protein n=1 Tax=Bursaphelenchus okinawaensis TaxID=465554 RepID=A0A811JUK5_9BILA|nr:unnamed protein product [Bursaphelenchus okinawaensis]CAG9083658.1 unnamed protein product [Bursaphelenchus okinawaensis]